MIRRRPPAENTIQGPKPKNMYWEMAKKMSKCPMCGRIHDGSNRLLDEQGKLVNQPARKDLSSAEETCEMFKERA